MPLYPRLSARVLGGLLLAASLASNALADGKTCECEFSSRDYQAYGTSGACGVFMYAKASICEISFAGIGANPDVLTNPTLGAFFTSRQHRGEGHEFHMPRRVIGP
ncbi:hypothetical protein FBY04_102439 [Pseudomonas sp. SJZ080]|nr:hypothetical protein FBY04_102439 [Pseudomonas sp. SJZ080]